MKRATAIAHPNIALSKYWGKCAGAGNFPAVPSLSLTLEGLSTTTRVTFDANEQSDVLSLNGVDAQGEPLVRVSALLDRVRACAKLDLRARVETRNDFPTASGLASSASGFAALALAATRAAGVDWDVFTVSDLARRSSASAARSLFGGLVELPAGAADVCETDLLSARVFDGAPDLAAALRVIVCVTTEGAKPHGSTDAMRATKDRSPYYETWLRVAPRLHDALKNALSLGDFEAAGRFAEESALAMHGCAVAAGFSYFNEATVRAMNAVRALRDQGTNAFFTVDAGPHVKVFVRAPEVARVGAALALVPGVLRTIVCSPGRGARLVTEREGSLEAVEAEAP